MQDDALIVLNDCMMNISALKVSAHYFNQLSPELKKSTQLCDQLSDISHQQYRDNTRHNSLIKMDFDSSEKITSK